MWPRFDPAGRAPLRQPRFPDREGAARAVPVGIAWHDASCAERGNGSDERPCDEPVDSDRPRAFDPRQPRAAANRKR